MCKGYCQLAYDERCPIKALKSRGISLREIADQLDRSPEQIEGRLKLLGEETVGWEWIYRQVRADIAERPAVVEEKSRIGDGELDTIIGARHRGAWLSSVDRRSKYTLLELLAGQAAAPVTEALLRRMEPFRDRTHTLTADNGKEFASHVEVATGLEAGFYFATPHHSWERGRNEHVNGLVRQYFPKGTDCRRVTAQPVKQVEDRLNHRPRKVPGYRTPFEVFHQGLASPCPPDRADTAVRPRPSGDGLARLQGLLQALHCRIVPSTMPESRDGHRCEAERMLQAPDSPPVCP